MPIRSCPDPNLVPRKRLFCFFYQVAIGEKTLGNEVSRSEPLSQSRSSLLAPISEQRDPPLPWNPFCTSPGTCAVLTRDLETILLEKKRRDSNTNRSSPATFPPPPQKKTSQYQLPAFFRRFASRSKTKTPGLPTSRPYTQMPAFFSRLSRKKGSHPPTFASHRDTVLSQAPAANRFWTSAREKNSNGCWVRIPKRCIPMGSLSALASFWDTRENIDMEKTAAGSGRKHVYI